MGEREIWKCHCLSGISNSHCMGYSFSTLDFLKLRKVWESYCITGQVDSAHWCLPWKVKVKSNLATAYLARPCQLCRRNALYAVAKLSIITNYLWQQTSHTLIISDYGRSSKVLSSLLFSYEGHACQSEYIIKALKHRMLYIDYVRTRYHDTAYRCMGDCHLHALLIRSSSQF